VQSVGMTRRRNSYLQAVMHADSVDEDLNVVTAPAGDEDVIEQSALDTVSEQEEPRIDEAPKEPPGLSAQTTVEEELIRSTEASPDEIPECEKAASGTDESSTRADILDNGSEELEVEENEGPPADCQTEIGCSTSGSVEPDLTVYEHRDADKSSLSDEELGESNSPDVDVWDSRLPDVMARSPAERDTEDAVGISGTPTSIPPTDCTADKPEEEEDTDPSSGVLPIPDQSGEGPSSVLKVLPPSSPPPPPPIDVIAIDIGGQFQVLDDVGIVDDEYCHSPLGGAMPESEDSSVAEFVFP